MDLDSPNTLPVAALKTVFIDQLNAMYYAKIHLSLNLPALIRQAKFKLLKIALEEHLADTNKQMVSMETILQLLRETPNSVNCLGMNAIIEEAYRHVVYRHESKYESDMSIIFYMGIVENMQMGACRMLNLLALKKEYLPYGQLVTECFDISSDNAELFQHVAKEYVEGN